MIGWAAHGLNPLPADPIFQRGTTTFDGTILSRTSAVTQDWPSYGGDAGGSRFSGLDDLTPANVSKLRPAWTFRIGGIHKQGKHNLSSVPIKIGDLLYTCTASNEVVAINPESGRQVWRYDPRTDLDGLSQTMTCRGVAYYRVPDAQGACAQRIFTNTVDARLIALDALTGRPCAGFGIGGQITLLKGMGHVVKGYYYPSSAPTIVRGRIILGGWVSDSQYWGEPSGVIRAFDAVTGRLSWAFDVGRPDRQGLPPAGESYTPSTPNSWAPMSGDEALGLVYAPTGGATPDYYGGHRRPFDDRYSGSVIAIDVTTGKVRWSFQAVHHDLWDYDVSSQPTLADIPGPTGLQRALVQATKSGELFLLDRVTGRPLAEVNERRVPGPSPKPAPGERFSPTQPFSDGMPSIRGPRLEERMMWGLTPLDQLWCRIQFRKLRYEGIYTPPGQDRAILESPGHAGGANWGSVSIDRDRGILITNTLHVANHTLLIDRKTADSLGLKPLTPKEGWAGTGNDVAQFNTPVAARVGMLLSPLMVPCQQPPFGTLSAVDLKTRRLLWTQPLGSALEIGPVGGRSRFRVPMGAPSMGGSMTTRGGLTFIGATPDSYFRAFETATGKLLWESRLPAGGQSIPMSYRGRDGRQYVVISAGGSNQIAAQMGDYIVAFALPARGAN